MEKKQYEKSLELLDQWLLETTPEQRKAYIARFPVYSELSPPPDSKTLEAEMLKILDSLQYEGVYQSNWRQLFISKVAELYSLSRNKEEFQNRIATWLHECFGDTIAKSVTERCYRFFEESAELIQSLGIPEEKAIELVKYVFSRDIGQPKQEVGGVMVTLAALCYAAELNMIKNGEDEYNRISQPEIMEKIRRKHNDKILRIPESALPGLPTPPKS